jgi:arabinofuranosyltransferase
MREFIRSNIFPYFLLISFAALVISTFFYQEWRLTGSLTGVPLDDSWIHYRFADNLRSGDGFSFNPGVPTSGSTSPLWVVLLSIIGGGYLIPSKIIGILAYVGVGILVYRFGLKADLEIPYALLAGLSTLAAGRLVWSAPSGMETTAFTFLTLVFIWLWYQVPKDLHPAASLTVGLASLLRPEGYLLIVLSGLTWVLVSWGKRQWVDVFIVVSRHFLLAGLVILPYFLFSYITTGSFLPNTFFAKTNAYFCHFGLDYFVWKVTIFLLDNPVMFILAIVGLVWVVRSGTWRIHPWITLSGLWLLGLPFIYGFIAPCISGYYLRYTAPLIPLAMLFGAFGGVRISLWMKNRFQKSDSRRKRHPLIILIMAEGLVLSLLPTLLFWAPFYGRSVSDLQDMHLNIAHWIVENTDPTDILAVNDIGAIGYITDREVIDLMGLVNPEALPLVAGKQPGDWDEGLVEYLRVKEPDYLIIFPEWFPKMAQSLPVEEVYRISLQDRTIAGIQAITIVGGGEKVVYRFNWGTDNSP